jgi:hypothetical protein
VQIAINTGKGKFVGIVGPAMNLRHDMLDVKCGQGKSSLVLAAIIDASAYAV